MKTFNCPYDEKVMIETIKNNNFENLIWLTKLNFPMNESVFYEAINNENPLIIKYLDLFRCPYSY